MMRYPLLKMSPFPVCLLISLIVSLVGCAPKATSVETPTPTPVQTQIDTPTPTPSQEANVVTPKTLIADFSATKTRAMMNEAIEFVSESTGDVKLYRWDFGDGVEEPRRLISNPSHKYAKGGSYTVSLTVENAESSYTIVKKDYITVSNLTISKLEYCIDITDSGAYTVQKGVFAGGDDLWIYFEVIGFQLGKSSGKPEITAEIGTTYLTEVRYEWSQPQASDLTVPKVSFWAKIGRVSNGSGLALFYCDVKVEDKISGDWYITRTLGIVLKDCDKTSPLK